MDGHLGALRGLVYMRAYCDLKVVSKTHYASPEFIAKTAGAITEKIGLAAEKPDSRNFLDLLSGPIFLVFILLCFIEIHIAQIDLGHIETNTSRKKIQQ